MLPTTKHEITFKDNHNVLSLDTFRIAGDVRFYYKHFLHFRMKIITMQIFMELKMLLEDLSVIHVVSVSKKYIALLGRYIKYYA